MKEGDTYGRWTAIRFSRVKRFPGGSQKHMWMFRCMCGNQSEEQAGNIISGKSKSCGCLSRELTSLNFKKHGDSRPGNPFHKLYMVWSSMKARCLNRRNSRWLDYGGRGISICERWMDYENFKEDMGRMYRDGLTVERVDNDNGYSPENCRWGTQTEQQNNKRTSRFLILRGETLTVSQWARKLGVSAGLLHTRIRRGWSVERTLSLRKANQ